MSYLQRRGFLAAATATHTLLDQEPAEAGRLSIRSGNKATTFWQGRRCPGIASDVPQSHACEPDLRHGSGLGMRTGRKS